METGKDVKVAEGSSAPVTVDEKGVPWENRAKENERKLEAAQKKIDALEARVNSIPESKEESAPEVKQEENKRKLMEFVEDPDAYFERRYAEKEFQKEVPQAQNWLKSQPGYSASEDESRIIQIIQERELFNQSPMKRAQTAFEILKAEKLEREFSKFKQDASRETNLNQAMGEGAGRSVKKDNTPRRADLLKQLAQAEKEQNYQRSAMLGDMLADVKE